MGSRADKFTPPKLDTLPAEIHLEIFKHLRTPLLKNLSLCNHRLYEGAQSCLYSTFSPAIWRASGETTIFYLVRTILEKPHLGERIKSFNAEMNTYREAIPCTLLTKESKAPWKEIKGFTWDSWEQWDLSSLEKELWI